MCEWARPPLLPYVCALWALFCRQDRLSGELEKPNKFREPEWKGLRASLRTERQRAWGRERKEPAWMGLEKTSVGSVLV